MSKRFPKRAFLNVCNQSPSLLGKVHNGGTYTGVKVPFRMLCHCMQDTEAVWTFKDVTLGEVKQNRLLTLLVIIDAHVEHCVNALSTCCIYVDLYALIKRNISFADNFEGLLLCNMMHILYQYCWVVIYVNVNPPVYSIFF